LAQASHLFPGVATVSATRFRSMVFTCQVCFEQCNDRLPLPELKTGNGDTLRADDCHHPICQECLATYVATRVQEQFVFHVRCPFEGCTNELFEQDLTRLVHAGALEASVSEHFAELRTRDYTTRAESLSQTLAHDIGKEDLDSMQILWATMRLCPRCSLAIERSEGCNSFYCICGHHFDFSAAPRVIGNGISNFGTVINTAKSLGLSIAETEKFGIDAGSVGKEWRRLRAVAAYHIVSRIATETRMSTDEAWELHVRAKSGDEEARTQIRKSRGRAQTTTMVGVDEEEAAYVLVWDDSVGEAHITQAEQHVANASVSVDIQSTQHVEQREDGAFYEASEENQAAALEPYTSSKLSQNWCKDSGTVQIISGNFSV